MNDLYLYRRHLYVNSDTQSLCSEATRPQDAGGVAVSVEHLGGMKHLCDDCQQQAEQYQHLRDTLEKSGIVVTPAGKLRDDFIKLAKVATVIILALIIITAVFYTGI